VWPGCDPGKKHLPTTWYIEKFEINSPKTTWNLNECSKFL
jgi:hypothetical protein